MNETEIETKTEPEIVTVECGGLNWCWLLEFRDHGDGTATIHRYYQLHRERDEALIPITSEDGRLVEAKDRTATHIELGVRQYDWRKPSRVLAIRNPKHVFDYER